MAELPAEARDAADLGRLGIGLITALRKKTSWIVENGMPAAIERTRLTERVVPLSINLVGFILARYS